MKEISVYADDSFTLKILPALKVAVGLGGAGWGGGLGGVGWGGGVGFWMEFLENFFKKSGGMVLTPQQTMQMFDTFSFHNRKMKFSFISLFLSS